MMDVRQLYISISPFVDKYVFVDAALSTLVFKYPIFPVEYVVIQCEAWDGGLAESNN